jgi:hypothetical protein
VRGAAAALAQDSSSSPSPFLLWRRTNLDRNVQFVSASANHGSRNDVECELFSRLIATCWAGRESDLRRGSFRNATSRLYSLRLGGGHCSTDETLGPFFANARATALHHALRASPHRDARIPCMGRSAYTQGHGTTEPTPTLCLWIPCTGRSTHTHNDMRQQRHKNGFTHGSGAGEFQLHSTNSKATTTTTTTTIRTTITTRQQQEQKQITPPPHFEIYKAR